ncbi:hypothetical protein EOPP23_00330 [Endozoicomonas sp. OPT23]|uniref:hypothetical protein n=1 Tax=Endozoicomonas sp. OPT23 TaxID=2072845 RepID=UPI00129A2C0D|nr:hypothetical protein [Endozoicomonas sp. OPT23]MRI31435.1 hypothetical protein [Endozoicomonas sp. OPT23]
MYPHIKTIALSFFVLSLGGCVVVDERPIYDDVIIEDVYIEDVYIEEVIVEEVIVEEEIIIL